MQRKKMKDQSDFGLLGHQRYQGIERKKIILLPINRWLYTHKRGRNLRGELVGAKNHPHIPIFITITNPLLTHGHAISLTHHTHI